MPVFDPTDEQLVALDLFRTGESLAIEAGAGTGKTSTLTLLAADNKARGQYLAFNKAIVVEASGKFPRHVNCATAHSLAFRATGKQRASRLQSSQRMPSWDIAKVLGISGMKAGDKFLSPSRLAGIAMRAVTLFCQSADPEPTTRHFPYIDGIDPPDEFDGRRTYLWNEQVRAYLIPHVRIAWTDITSESGVLPFKHEHYLKMWQLDSPVISAEYILFDEAQDANPVMVDIVRQQEHAQLVFVGDSQQQIYGFTGAVNALADVPADRRAFLTQSFRFGQPIADVANTVLDSLNAELRLTGFEEIVSEVGAVESPDVYLTRTNAAAVHRVLEAQRAGVSVHLVGGGKEVLSFARAAEKLLDGRKTEHPELACFDSWDEVRDYVTTDEQGDELRLMVRLVDEFTPPTIINALGNMAPESKAQLVVSTAHKSKGREWTTVQLADDFPDDPESEELRLLYVSVTRAKGKLDHRHVGYFNPAARKKPSAVEVATQGGPPE